MNISAIRPIESPTSTVAPKGAPTTTPGGTISDQIELSALAVQLMQTRNAATATANIAEAAGHVSGALVNVLG